MLSYQRVYLLLEKFFTENDQRSLSFRYAFPSEGMSRLSFARANEEKWKGKDATIVGINQGKSLDVCRSDQRIISSITLNSDQSPTSIELYMAGERERKRREPVTAPRLLFLGIAAGLAPCLCARSRLRVTSPIGWIDLLFFLNRVRLDIAGRSSIDGVSVPPIRSWSLSVDFKVKQRWEHDIFREKNKTQQIPMRFITTEIDRTKCMPFLFLLLLMIVRTKTI